MIKQDDLMGMKEISEVAGYSWQTVEKLIKEEGFPAVKLRGRWISSRKIISEWKEKQMRSILDKN